MILQIAVASVETVNCYTLCSQEVGIHRFRPLYQHKFTAIHPIIRVHASELYVFRLRNYSDLQTFLEELGGVVGNQQTLLEMYIGATLLPYSFLYCRLTEKDKHNMFYINYSKRFEIED